MIPSIGRIVHYQLSEHDVEMINRRRKDATNHMADHRANANGVMVHVGNQVSAGDEFPLIITRVWASREDVSEATAVNGQVLLDGSDSLWVTSVTQGDGFRHWHESPRI